MAIKKRVAVDAVFTVKVSTSFEVDNKETVTIDELEKMAKRELRELQEELGIDELESNISEMTVRFNL